MKGNPKIKLALNADSPEGQYTQRWGTINVKWNPEGHCAQRWGTINVKGNPQIKLAVNKMLTVRKGNTLRGEEQLTGRGIPRSSCPWTRCWQFGRTIHSEVTFYTYLQLHQYYWKWSELFNWQTILLQVQHLESYWTSIMVIKFPWHAYSTYEILSNGTKVNDLVTLTMTFDLHLQKNWHA